jgi:hypothetical protein
MSKTKETVFSEEGVPVADQDAAGAEADDLEAADAEAKIHEIGPEPGDVRKLDEDEAVEQAETIQSVVETPKTVQGDRAQDHLAFDNARREEAIAQGVVKTTSEALWEISREEEAIGQGVDGIDETTQKTLFRQSRLEEIDAGKREQAAHGPVVESVEQIDTVKRDAELAKETKALRKQAGDKS